MVQTVVREGPGRGRVDRQLLLGVARLGGDGGERDNSDATRIHDGRWLGVAVVDGLVLQWCSK